MQYPAHDAEFKEHLIERVEEFDDGTYAITCDGWTLWCGSDCAVKPQVGNTARQYGGGIGYPVRGLFIDGQKVWYRTEADEKEYSEIQRYGVDARDWLKRWDDGRGVWTIEMGGLGPGYEQCIQVTVAEMLRWFIEHECASLKWSDSEAWKRDRDEMEHALMELPVVQELGLSGAQWGAAVSLATCLYREGPRKVMADDRVKDRHIQVSKNFPGRTAA